MYFNSIIFGISLIHIGWSLPVPGDDGEELIQIPRKLFTELMGKRDELIRLQYRQSVQAGKNGSTTPKEPVHKKIHKVLDKIKQWGDNVVQKAGIEDEVADFKIALKEGKKSGKEFLRAGKEGGKQLLHMGGKVLKIALKIEPRAHTRA